MKYQYLQAEKGIVSARNHFRTEKKIVSDWYWLCFVHIDI